MRIQHNISALNAHRQLGNNNSFVSRNLEKLSSGYRINKAGDDAAGLAISEKMRAQIKGLDTAQKNAQDGISLVQTAEGALTEVHSMLNRMTELATQSANGTYQNETDRENLQKEIDSLKKEINRISAGTNYNGIKLLNGTTLGGSANVTSTKGGELSVKADAAMDAAGIASIDFAGGTEGDDFEVQTTLHEDKGTISIGGGTFTLTGDADFAKLGALKDYQIEFNDTNGGTEAVTLDATNKKIVITVDTTTNPLGGVNDAAKATALATKINGFLAGATESSGTDAAGLAALKAASFTCTNSAGFTAGGVGNVAASATSAVGAGKVTVTLSGASTDTADFDIADFTDGATLTVGAATITLKNDAGSASGLVGATTAAAVKMGEIAKSAGTVVYDLTKLPQKGNTVEVGNKTFEFVENANDVTAGNVGVVIGNTTAATAANLKAAFDGAGVTGVSADYVAGETKVTFKNTDAADNVPAPKVEANGGGLVLQIGEDSQSYNRVSVVVDAMDTEHLDIDDINISTQEGAQDALDKIKNAINIVSSTRGDLGALQNRLDHTINNLGVASENMSAAESRIRDVDMAKEMMDFTKNNILTQASQAMLAQANQLPQGVLQLLQ